MIAWSRMPPYPYTPLYSTKLPRQPTNHLPTTRLVLRVRWLGLNSGCTPNLPSSGANSGGALFAG